jgi:hypothetical protein
VDGQKLDIDTAKWWPSATIPGLDPYGLATVPGFRLLPGAVVPAGWRPTPGEPNPYEDTTWRRDHRAWTRKLCDKVRPWIHARGNADPDFAARERALCAADPNYFGAVYGWIFDPKPRADEPMRKPYAKFAYQCHNTTAQQEHIALTHRTALWRPKSRQLGISWDDEHFDAWFYLFQEGQAKLVSRNEKLVYNGRSTEAMLGKVIYILSKLDEFTPYLLPAGFRIRNLLTRPWFRDLALINPLSETVLVGESTTKEVGRGGTYTFGRPDEAGFIDNLSDAVTSLSEAALHMFFASTERANDYLDMWQAAKRETPLSVMEFNWHQNAYLDLAWEREAIANAVSKVQQEGLWREAFRDPFAGFGVWTYPEARELPDANQPYRPDEPLDTTIDPAGTGDSLALMGCQATAVDGNEGFHVLWSYEREMPNPEWVAHVCTGIWPERGDACHGMHPDAQERELGAFYYEAWRDGRELRWFMDPAADQWHGGDSYLKMFKGKTKELHDREYERLKIEQIVREEAGLRVSALPVPTGIHPRINMLKKFRHMGEREYALRKYLPFVTFQTGVLSASRVRECLGRTRYNDLSDQAVTAPKRRHDQYSHLASCCEYYALYYLKRFIDPLDTRALRKRMTGLGLPGNAVPSFVRPAVPSNFGKVGALPGARQERRPPIGIKERTAPGGWR